MLDIVISSRLNYLRDYTIYPTVIFFIDVILPIPLQKAFTYHITKAEAEFLKPGIRVAVPFGKSKIYTALAYKIHNNPPTAYEAKTIHQI